MNYFNMRLWTATDDIMIPPMGKDGKNVCLIFFGKNTNFSETYNFLNLNRNNVRYVNVPTVTYPIKSWMTPDIRKNILGFKLISYDFFLEINF